MPKRSNEFQKLVTLINGCLNDSGKVVESALLVDKTSGAKREVDVLVSTELADYPVNISVEVRDRKRKADITWVGEMHAKHSHLPTDKLVLVSRHGFTKPALDKAKFYGIEAITFEEALDTDWELAARMTSTGIFTVTTCNYKCSAVCEHPDGKKTFSPANRSTTVFLPYRETPTDFDKMAQYFIFEPRIKKVLDEQLENTNKRIFWFDYTPQRGTYVLDSDQTKMPLLKFRVEIEAERTDTPIKFASGRYGKREVALGASSDPDAQLYYAVVRKEGDRAEGLLFDKKGIRKLIPET